jgi:solute carrier family 25 carnitine/acylcarnitine transporter 20/29
VTDLANLEVDSIKKPRFSGVIDAYRQTWRETFNPSKSFSWNAIARTRNFYKVSHAPIVNYAIYTRNADMQGFVPVVLRAFPTNAAALAVWEGVMRWSAKNDVSF